jgi:hypothetical protein
VGGAGVTAIFGVVLATLCSGGEGQRGAAGAGGGEEERGEGQGGHHHQEAHDGVLRTQHSTHTGAAGEVWSTL